MSEDKSSCVSFGNSSDCIGRLIRRQGGRKLTFVFGGERGSDAASVL